MPTTTDTCYVCAGRGYITVDSFDANVEPHPFQSDCVRCFGRGSISDGMGREELRRFLPRMQSYEPECTCDFPTHGPLGDPYCPSR